MKRIIIFAVFLIVTNYLIGQTDVIFKANYFIYGKDLKRLDKRFKNDKDYPKTKYLVIEAFNSTNDTLYFCEYGQNFNVSSEECYYNETDNPIISTPYNFCLRKIRVLPKQKQFFIRGIIESNTEKLIKCRYTIEYFTKDVVDLKYSRSSSFEIYVLNIRVLSKVN